MRSQRRLSNLISSVIFQCYQRLKVLSQFLRSQFIFDGVRQILVDSGDQGLCIPPTLGGEGAELNAKVSHWSGPWADVEQSAGRFSSSGWVAWLKTH
jgi:hypothetical protein